MNTTLTGSLDFAQIIQRKLAFHLNNDIIPKEGNENSDRGEQHALERRLADSQTLTEPEFESKYLGEIAELKACAEGKDFSVEDGDDYFEAYNNTVVVVLALLKPVHLCDFSDRNQT